MKHIIDWVPLKKGGKMAKVPSAGDMCKDSNGNDTDKLLDIPDWDKGIMSRENSDWFAKVQIAVREDIKAVSQRFIFKHG